MSSLFDFDARPDRYAVMGNPIAHSKSPTIHAMFAEQTGQRIEYSAILVDLGGFPQAVGNFAASGGKGLNVTVPFKQEAWALVDTRSARAQRAGAVNTIKIEQDGGLYGDNTDGIGLVNDLTINHGCIIESRRVLVIGAGGASRGVLGPLLNQRPASLVIANRTPDRAVELAQQLKDLGPIAGCGFSGLAKQNFDVVINATSASLQGDVPDIAASALRADTFCYDMMYGAEPTAFMRWCRGHSAQHVADGLGMLVEQAAESFLIWRGMRPQTKWHGYVFSSHIVLVPSIGAQSDEARTPKPLAWRSQHQASWP